MHNVTKLNKGVILHFQEKKSVKSITSDKSKSDKDSETVKLLDEERKRNNELQKELDLQVSYRRII